MFLYIALFAFHFSLSVGCLSPLHSATTDVDAVAWSAPATLVFANADTTARRNFQLLLRCNDRFTEDTLTLRIAIQTPDSLRYEETFRLTIPAAQRRPAAIRRELTIPYRRRVVLDRRGDYHITITPTRPLRGIEAVGIDTD